MKSPPLLLVALVLSMDVGMSTAQCVTWRETSPSTFDGVSSPTVWGFAYHDSDGSGTQPTRLFATGTFRKVGGADAAGIAVFDNGEWHGLGQPDDSIDSRWLINFDHDGNPSTPAWLVGMARRGRDMPDYPLVTRWSGSGWEPIGDLTRGSESSDPEVTFATGFDEDGAGPNPPTLFISGGSGAGFGVRRLQDGHWLGTGQSSFGNGCYALTVFDSDDLRPQPPVLLGQGLTGFLQRRVGNGWTFYGNAMTVRNSIGANHFRCNPVVFDSDGPGPRASELVVSAYQILTAQGDFYGAAAFNGTTWRGLGPANPPQFPQQAFRSAWLVDVDGPGLDGEELILCGTSSVQWLHHGQWVTIPIVATGVAGYREGVEGPAPNELWFAGAFTEAGGMPARGFARCRVVDSIALDSGPVSQSASRAGDVSFTTIVRGANPIFQWRRNQVPLTDGAGGASFNGGSVSGANTNVLTLAGVACSDEGTYDCLISNECGGVSSGNAEMTVLSTCCAADLDSDGILDNGATPDGVVSIDDLLFFVAAFEMGSQHADVANGTGTGTRDSSVTIDDLLYFLDHFERGC